MSVNIQGIDKVQLLHALWDNIRPAAFYSFTLTNPPCFNSVRAAQAVKSYIDYYDGRCM